LPVSVFVMIPALASGLCNCTFLAPIESAEKTNGFRRSGAPRAA
jgi:hypothetical protein